MEISKFVRESLGVINTYMIKSLQKEAEKLGLTVPQVRIIAEVFFKESISIKQLSVNLRMTQSTVSDIVDRLIANGHVFKTPDPKDRRSVKISLSDERKKSLAERSLNNEAISELLNLLEPEEQKIVEEGLRLLVLAVKEKVKSEGENYFDYQNMAIFTKNAE